MTDVERLAELDRVLRRFERTATFLAAWDLSGSWRRSRALAVDMRRLVAARRIRAEVDEAVR